MKSQMTIGKKLTIGFSILLFLILCQAYSSLSSSATLSDELKTAVNKTAKKVDLIDSLETEITSMRASQRGTVLFSIMKDKALSDKLRAQFRESVTTVAKLSSEIQPLLESDVSRSDLATIQARVADWTKIFDNVEKSCAEQRFDSALTADLERSVALASDAARLSNVIQERQAALLTAASTKADALSSRVRWIAFFLIIMSAAVGALVLWLVRNVSAELRGVAHELGAGAGQVASAAGQVSASSQALAQGSSEQAASLEETSASSEEINSMAHRNSENSRSAAELVDRSQQEFSKTNERLELMVVAMDEINSSSDKISKIIKVIDEIAFQTNILALNAAVEAARAGEAGMGFAVVADEVRNLAQRSAQAAKDTAALIEESIAKSTDGKLKMDQVAEAIREITAESTKIKTLVDEVNLGSQEQARGIDQIGRAITEMEKVTQSTAAHAEEGAAAAEELTAQSERLREIVDHLNSLVGGGSGSATVVRTVSSTSASLRKSFKAAPKSVRPVKASAETGEPVGTVSGRESFPLDFEGESF